MNVRSHFEAISTIPCGHLYANLMFWCFLLTLRINLFNKWIVVMMSEVCVFWIRRKWMGEGIYLYSLKIQIYYGLITFIKCEIFYHSDQLCRKLWGKGKEKEGCYYLPDSHDDVEISHGWYSWLGKTAQLLYFRPFMKSLW